MMEFVRVVLCLLVSFLLVELGTSDTQWSKQTKCWTKKKGVCVSTVSDDWKCPFPDGKSTPFGCPKDHICCIPNKKARARKVVPGGCGFPPLFKKTSADRIVGGWGVKPGELPWQVLLRPSRFWKNDKFPPPNPFCGGSIIHKDWVLSAAHCFGQVSPVQPNRPDDLRVVTGVINVKDSAKNDSKPVQVHAAQKIIMHPKYDPNTDRNDIALIKMARPIEFNDYSAPVCLPEAKEDLQNTICTVSGWGIINSTTEVTSTFLRGLNIPVIPTSTCRKIHHDKDVLNAIFKTNLCTLFVAGGRDACGGDSGGPLACRMNSGQYILGGVVSWGDADGCAIKKLPGVFTQVSDYVDWIEKTTGINFPS